MNNYTFSNQQLDNLYHYIKPIFTFSQEVLTPLYIQEIPLGFLNEKFRIRLLTDLPKYTTLKEDGVHFYCDDFLQAGDLLQNIAYEWYKMGIYDGWRNETFEVRDNVGNSLFSIERSAFRPLGLLSHAVHINGLKQHDQQTLFWIGKRSPYKSVGANKLDNLVGGGVSTGETIKEAMKREAFEEAGLSNHLLENLQKQSCILSQRLVNRGIHREYLHIFDITLPEHFIPQNQDGEVSSFKLMCAEEVYSAIITEQFTNDAVMCLLDYFYRLGYLKTNHPLTQWLNPLYHYPKIL